MSREEAVEILSDMRAEYNLFGDEEEATRYHVLSMAIQEMKAKQPEREKGEWIYGENCGQDGWFCSECGFFVPWYYEYYGLDNIDFIADFHICPKCDSKMLKYTGMRGEQDG